MTSFTLSRFGVLIILISFVFLPEALAQRFGVPESTTWTIGEPTDVGGTVLQPGTYRISVVPRDQGRHVVRVTSDDGQQVITTLLTVPHPLEPNEEMPTSMFVFYPADEGRPRALRTWFPADPTGSVGHDIVYEEGRARALASAADRPVVFYREIEETVDLETTELQVVTPEARIETYVVPDFTTRVTTVETRRPTMVAEARTELPATAGKTPLLALLGLLSIAAALAFRAANR